MILLSSLAGRLLVGWMADRFPRKTVMIGTYALVTATIPLLLLVRPGSEWSLYAFAILFGFGMGADFMLIPLMAADQFGLTHLRSRHVHHLADRRSAKPGSPGVASSVKPGAATITPCW
jgi:MFS family permease